MATSVGLPSVFFDMNNGPQVAVVFYVNATGVLRIMMILLLFVFSQYDQSGPAGTAVTLIQLEKHTPHFCQQ